MRIRIRPLLALSAVTAALLMLAACSDAPSVDSSDGRSSDSLPDGVAVAVYQSRSDVVSRSLQVSVENGSTEDLLISGAEFTSTQFAETAVWQKDSTTVRAGRTIDLPVQLSESVCDERDPTPTVRLTWSTDGDRAGTTEVTPTDERGRLAELRAEGCFDAAVSAIGVFSADTPPRTVTIDGAPAAKLDITVTPAEGGGDAGELLVESVSGTTLFTMLDPPTGATTTSLPLGLRIGSAGSVITLTLIPTRCDPHAVAEDKQGTIFPFTVEAPAVDGEGTTTGTVFVATPTAIKQSLIAFIGAACGTASAG